MESNRIGERSGFFPIRISVGSDAKSSSSSQGQLHLPTQKQSTVHHFQTPSMWRFKSLLMKFLLLHAVFDDDFFH